MTMTQATSITPALGCRAELTGLTDDELLVRFRALPRDSHERAAACEILVERYERLVRSCVRQYRGSPEPVEDLMQVGYVGLLKAINNFDPSFGSSLSAHAAACVSGARTSPPRSAAGRPTRSSSSGSAAPPTTCSRPGRPTWSSPPTRSTRR